VRVDPHSSMASVILANYQYDLVLPEENPQPKIYVHCGWLELSINLSQVDVLNVVPNTTEQVRMIQVACRTFKIGDWP
jgi:hypothetical protein